MSGSLFTAVSMRNQQSRSEILRLQKREMLLRLKEMRLSGGKKKENCNPFDSSFTPAANMTSFSLRGTIYCSGEDHSDSGMPRAPV